MGPYSINTTTVHFFLYFLDEQQELRKLKKFAKQHIAGKWQHWDSRHFGLTSKIRIYLIPTL